VLAALLRIGWRVVRQRGSHRVLARDGFLNFVFAFHDGDGLVLACWRESRSTLVSLRATCKRRLTHVAPAERRPADFTVRSAAAGDHSVFRTRPRALRLAD
jgi:hypothetical protein